MKRLGLDIDGVIYPWHYYVYRYFKGKVGRGVSYKKFWSNGHYENLVKQIVDISDFYFVNRVDKNIVDMINRLSSRYDIFYITGRNEHLRKQTSKWLRKFEFPKPDFIYTTKNKRETIKTLGINYYVEDSPHYIIELSGITDIIGVRQPWNEHIKNYCIWIDSILELEGVLDLLEEIYNKNNNLEYP